MEPISFGTDGWRGVIAEDFTYDKVWLVACAISRYVLKHSSGIPELLIGYDTRFSSDRFAQVSALAASEHNIKVRISKTFVPTPSISFATMDMKTDGAIMITASHNPPRYDGIKFKAPYGGSASTAITSEIEKELRILENSPPPRPDVLFEDALKEGKIELFEPIPRYLEKVVSLVDPEKISNAGDLKITFDPMYGAGQGLMKRALETLGLSCEEIHGVHNPLFPGLQPEPIGSNLNDLREAVVRRGCHAGIAVDGDADRVTAIDASGMFISSHMVFALLLKHLIEQRGWTGNVVKTVSTTSMIDRLCERYDLKLHVVPVGFKHICDLMLEEDILIGGEESGGTGIKNHIPERDGILVGLLLIEIMATHKKTLGQLITSLMEELGRKFVYLRKDIELTHSQKASLLSSLPNLRPSEIGGQKVVDAETIDGLKFHREDGSWLMLRVSGTESVVRIYSEATSEAEVEALVKEGEKLIYSVDRNL
ncbi:MAG: phosphoglucomutase/phosphomannomutase family protein [Actinomycetota bacterium]|nr:phosphoglucomutase/phosphomannomutase family protein [Actinomycetota bacterium]